MPATPTASTKAPTAAELQAQLAAMREKLDSAKESTKAARQGRGLAAAAPSVRKGEDPFTSRGYSFCKLFQVMAGLTRPEDARVEVDTHNELFSLLCNSYGYQKSEANTLLAPFAAEFLPQTSDSERRFAAELRTKVKAGVSGFDPKQAAWEIGRLPASVRKTLSWTDETALGALVAPPQFGELIEVFRNNEVLMNAGASTIAMPPNGRIVYPRQTGAATAYYVGESAQITSSEQQTGDLVLQAKKVASLVKLPNELFRYASISVEAFVRQDMVKVMALKMDKELLEGVGSTNSPKGLINYSGINTWTSKGTPADANSGYPLQPEDLYNAISTVEEVNATFRSWIMRPQMYAYIVNRRADSVTAGDGKGMFLFNVWRELGEDFSLERMKVGSLAGYPAHKSTQISKARTRGTGTTQNTYLLGGDFSDYIIAAMPTIEFAMTQQGDTAFANDQSWIRAILAHDGGPRHEVSFVLVDNLLMS